MTWFVVRTKPNCENRAKESFLREGWNPYLPVIQGPLDKNPKPFFPRYMFLETGNYDPISAQYAYGVAGILRQASDEGRFARIDDIVVWMLREQEEEGIIRPDLPPASKRDWRPGDQVTVDLQGKLLVGTLISMPAADRVIVLLGMLGAQREIAAPLLQVEKV